MTKDEALAAIRVGDKVTVAQPYYPQMAEWIVTKITPTQIVCGVTRFYKKSGTEVTSLSRQCCIIFGEEIAERQRHIDIGLVSRTIKNGCLMDQASITGMRKWLDKAEALLRADNAWSDTDVGAEP